MHNPVEVSERRRHSLSDWLALHALDAASCHRILDAIVWDDASDPTADATPDSKYSAPDLDAAWLGTADAMRNFLPAHQTVVDDTFANTPRIVIDRRGKSRKALTLDNGPPNYPTILLSYSAEPADYLVMAHEFGHALQIRASGGKFVPPIMREVCAFLGEAALLSHARQGDVTRREWLAHVWRKDDARYLGILKDRLKAALHRPATPYSYAWNYPIARLLAIRLFERGSRERLWSVFQGSATVQALEKDLTLPHV